MPIPETFRSGRIMLVAFEGWNDAGDAASSVLKLLFEQSEIESITEYDADDFFDYQFNRPQARLNDEGERELIWPQVNLTVVQPTHLGKTTGDVDPDLSEKTAEADDSELTFVLLQGAEPSRGWMTFSEEITEIALDLQVTGIIFLGALLADVPHTRPISIYTTSDEPELREALNLSRSTYEGPVGILTVLAESAADHGIPALTLWASVPHYVHNAPSPKATLALLLKLQDLLGFEADHSALDAEATAWEASIDAMSQEDEDLAHYIQQLEKARDTVDSPEASGDAIAEEFEKYLRLKNDDDPRNDGPRRGPEN